MVRALGDDQVIRVAPSWIGLVFLRRDPPELPSPFFQVRLQEVHDLEEGPHLAMPAWAQPSNLHSYEPYVPVYAAGLWSFAVAI